MPALAEDGWQAAQAGNPMEPFSVRTTLTLADWRAYQKTCAQQLRGQQRFWINAPAMALIAAVTFGILWLMDTFNQELNPLSAFLGIAFAMAVILMARRRARESVNPEQGGAFFAPCSYEFGADGIQAVQQGLRLHSEWSRVRVITATAEYIYLWVDRFAAHIVPLRDLPAGMTGDDAVGRLRAWAASTAPQVDLAPLPAVASSDPAQPETPSATSRQQWPRTVLRLLSLRGADGAAPSGSIASIAMLSILSLALWTGIDWVRNTPEPEFYPYGVPALAWFVLAALLTAGAMARKSYPALALSRACALLAIVIPVLIVVYFAIDRYVPERWVVTAQFGLAIYALAYCDRGLKTLTGGRQPVALAAGILVALAFVGVGSAVYVSPSLWVAADAFDDVANEAGWDAGEDILFEQSARIDASVTNIARPPGAAPVGFFVGFAGYGEQRVFAEETKFAGQVFGRRYDTSSRSLLLINDRRDLGAQPLATVSGLRYALKKLAARMQLDRDILFLVLSSHGSEGSSLSISNGSMPLRDLSGDALAEALGEAGIKWRVIVISACYAGGFIQPLQSPETIVITAAAPDRTSFGCSDERDLTYFGEAFLRDSVPGAPSLHDAFDAARTLIAEREAQEGVEASNPQAFFGAAMERRLAEVEKAVRE
jgi:hypothetical protein